MKTGEADQKKKSVTSSPLAVSFLWVSASPRAEPSTPNSWKTTTHVFSAAPPHRILCIFEHMVILAGLFWPSQDCLSAAQWWYKFLLPPLPQIECFPDGERWQWYSAISEVRHRENSEQRPHRWTSCFILTKRMLGKVFQFTMFTVWCKL